LKKHRIPATIYVTQALVDGTSGLWWYEQECLVARLPRIELRHRRRPLSWVTVTPEEKQVAFLEMNRLTKEMAPDEQAELMEELGHAVEHFAYPFGGAEHAGPREFEAARKAGFASALTTRIGHVQAFHAGRPHSIPRIAVDFRDDLKSFRWKLSGLQASVRRP